MPGVDRRVADYGAKRLILEIVCLGCHLDGATLVPQSRKPCDVVIGLSHSSMIRVHEIEAARPQ
jgi:hypothetical protein